MTEKFGLNKLAAEIHLNAINHGWYEKKPSFPEAVALFHSELSEALEEYRKGKGISDIDFVCGLKNCTNETKDCGTCCYSKPTGIGVELADCIIRILDTCSAENINIGAAVRLKHEYNKRRPYKHGGKRI